MKILPVNNFSKPNIVLKNLSNNQNYQLQPKISFTSDSFQMGTFLDQQLQDLQQVVTTEITPFLNTHKEEYMQVCKIGYDAQEKLKVIELYNQKLFDKKFHSTDNDKFKEVEKVTDIYKKYNDNIKIYEKISSNIINSDMFSSPELLHEIEKRRPKVYLEQAEFEKIKPLYNIYINTKEAINVDLEGVETKNNPKLQEQIKYLKDVNVAAIFLIMRSGYSDMLSLTRETEKLLKDYTSKTQPLHSIMERAEKLSNEVLKIQNNMEMYNNNINEITEFLKKQKDYNNIAMSEYEIIDTYKKMFSLSDNIVKAHSNKLYEYFKQNKPKLNPRLIDKALKAQERANRIISNMLQERKKAYYEQCNKEFNDRYKNEF